jgi:hypothetical protein
MYITTRPVSHDFLLVHPQQFFSFLQFLLFYPPGAIPFILRLSLIIQV